MDPATQELVEITFDGPVAVLRLHRPDQLNALSDALLRRIGTALDEIDGDPGCRALVVTGAGRAFCAGADLRELADRLDADDRAGVVSFVELAGRTFTRLAELPLPVVAAVNGTAIAGGFELVLACDIVLAAPGALLGDGHLRYGVLPGGGGAVRLAHTVPANVARRLLLTGDLEPAERFRDWGLVDEVVPQPELIDRAVGLAHRLTQRSPLGLREVKRVANAARDLPTAAALRLEFDAFVGYVGSADLREGLQAFADRQAPRFTGR